MPLNRYQIRNEYSLADPELYRAADKDDPEALLEGVAMAGLVGVLRQLGDLAEFAAEIFHDLHEEVMVTAARGHSLTARVQQLESEFPAIEKAFLSQTNHSSFFYNPGLDWHPNMHMDQSLITQGDLPRFVMDSYEECRGPPRLFLLDKFDVAGAGACLKRYSDPSFFREEPSSFGITGRDIQREKKGRKSKKKGSRWRNGETPEALPTSHAKLHQLFLEERIHNGFSDPARHVKLKRRLNGFPFTSKSGKSYMEKFLKSPSPDHKEVHEIPVDPLISDIDGIGKMSPEKELDSRSISLPSPPAKEKITPVLFEDTLDEVPSDTRDSVMLQSRPDLESYGISGSCVEVYNIPSNFQMEDSEKEIVVDDGSKTDDSIEDYQSDDIASEIDNYLDALTTMESEMDTDSEVKIRNDLRYLNSKRETRALGASDVQLQAHSSDSQSVGNSTLSDDGNSMSKKEVSSFSYSDTHSIAAENTPSDGEVPCNFFSSITEAHETEIIDSSLNQNPINKENLESHPAGSALLDGLSAEAIESPSHSPEIADQSDSPSGSDPSCRNREAFTEESTAVISEMGKEVTSPRLSIPSICEATEQGDYDFPQTLPCENQLMDESEEGEKDTNQIIPVTSLFSVFSHSKDDLQLHLLAENKVVDKLNDEDVNQDESFASLTNQDLSDNDPSQINREKLSLWSHDDQQEELHVEDLDVSKSAPIATNLFDSPSQLRDGLPGALSTETLLVKEVADEYPSSSVDCLSNIVADKQSEENSVNSASKGENGEGFTLLNSDENQFGEQNIAMFHIEWQPHDQSYSSDAEDRDTVSKINNINQSPGEADNLTPKEDTLSELVEPLALEINTEVLSITSLEKQTSCSREVNLNEPLVTRDGAEMSEIAHYTNLCETDPCGECLLLAGDHVDLDERDTNSVNATPDLSVPDSNVFVNDDGSSGNLKTLQDVPESGPLDEVKGLITEEACFLEGPAQPDATDGLHQQILSLQGSNSGDGHLVDSSHLESDSQIPNNPYVTFIPLEAKDNVNATTAIPTQSSFEQIELEFSHTEGKVDSLTDQFDQQHVCEADSEVITDIEQIQYEEQIDQVGLFDSSNSVPIKLPGEPSETKFSLQGSNNSEISEHQIHPSSSILSSLSPLPASQIYVDEMPPMPPLPPVQWRMTKFQQAPPVQERVSVLNNASSWPPLFPSEDQDTQPVNQLLPKSVLGDDSSHPAMQQVSSVVHHGDFKDNILPLQEMQYRDNLQLPEADGDILQNSVRDDERENEKSRSNLSSNLSHADPVSSYVSEMPHEFTKHLNQESQETSLNRKESIPKTSIAEENAVTFDKTAIPSKTVYAQPEQVPASILAFGLPNEKLTRPLNQETPEINPNEKELESRPEPLEEILVSSNNNSISEKTGNEQPQHAISTSEATLALPVGEEYKPNGLRPAKLPRPRNPLIDAVAAHDKSKLRKVNERIRPQIQKEDERDSLLEQIRAKSFNLKPAVVTRPSIPGPTTNLKVAAILEKAKTIRQAFAGSDEDDDDNWSDS